MKVPPRSNTAHLSVRGLLLGLLFGAADLSSGNVDGGAFIDEHAEEHPAEQAAEGPKDGVEVNAREQCHADSPK